MSKRSVRCLISGTQYTLSQDYYAKKIEEYSDEDTLQRFFVTKRVKGLIARGYDACEIRNILEIDEKDLFDCDSPEINNIINYHKSKSDIALRRTNASFVNLKTDADVSEFINNIKSSREL